MLDKRLVCVIMGQNCERFIGMCLESVKDADVIVYCDGGSTDKTIPIVDNFFISRGKDDKIIENKYNQDDKQMNGKQRNFYLKYLKENYPDDWALVLDADEVVEDLSQLKRAIQFFRPGLYSVHMRHFHNDLGHEDATQEKHWVLNRLFKISETDTYPEVEHPVLQGKAGAEIYETNYTTIWHLAHINHCFNIKNRYEKNMKHSNIHSPEFLDNWKDAHMFGTYPSKSVNPIEIPDIILNYFHINKDKYYFKDRQLEYKHWIDVINYKKYYNL